MSLSLADAGKFFSQALGGGARGQLQTESAFAYGYGKLRATINDRLGRTLGKLGNFGLADALGKGASRAAGVAQAQEVGLLSSIGIPPGAPTWAVLAAVGLILGVVLWRKI